MHTECDSMSHQPELTNELRRLVEERMDRTLEGIEDTLRHVMENQEINLDDLKGAIKGLEKSFSLLSQKWNLEILYMLFLRKTMGFSEVKKALGVNSRTLSDKLKSLNTHEYISRAVEKGPPIRARYALTEKGRNIVLLALPLLYYSRS